MDVFSKNAAKYWAAGISVIPLHAEAKRPFHNEWTKWCYELPTKEEQDFWISRYTNNNMGVALGPQSNLVFIDIDSLDPKIEAAIMSVLPPSPWRRVGAKGCVLAYKCSGEKPKKIFDVNGKTLVEILAEGNQAVMPPSIHPDTKKPYTSNVELLDVFDELHALPKDIEERLRAVLSTVTTLRQKSTTGFNVANFIPNGARDTALTAFAGLMAFAVLRGNRTLREALQVADAWTEEMVEKSNGDNMDPNKTKRKIIEFLMNDVTSRGKILPPGWDLEISVEEKVQWGLTVNESQEEWTVVQIKDYLQQQLTDLDLNDPKRHEVVDFILKKVAKSIHLSELDKSTILQTLKKNSGLDLPMSAYTKQLRLLTEGPVEGTNHTEIAKEVLKLYNERQGILAHYADDLWRWTGSHWELIDDQTIWQIIADEFGDLVAAKRASDHKGIISVIKTLVPQHIKTVDLDGVNFQNGFLTKAGELVEHAPEQGMTYLLPYSYKPELAGKCPMFMSYLEASWGHHADYVDKKKALQEAMAVTIFGMAPKFQRAFLLYGVGGTGKSVILDIIQTFVPDRARAAIAPHQWGDKFACADFQGVLLNSAGELHESKKIDGDAFKKIISGDEMQVEKKNGHPFKMKSKAAQWFASNYLPKSRDTSNGFNRRWLIFSFDKLVGSEAVIRDYGKIIAVNEVEGIVAWAIESFSGLLARGDYVQSASHVEALKQMSLGNSNIRQWMDERIEVEAGSRVGNKVLYTDYWAYSLALMGGKIPNPVVFKTEFNQILLEKSLFETSLGKEGDIYHNLRLKNAKS